MVEAPGLCDCAELVKVGTRKTTGDIVGNEISGEGLGCCWKINSGWIEKE